MAGAALVDETWAAVRRRRLPLVLRARASTSSWRPAAPSRSRPPGNGSASGPPSPWSAAARGAASWTTPSSSPRATDERRRAVLLPADTIEFLADLRRHNNKGWFDAHRDRYETAYVEPAKAFVEAAAPGLATIVPGITAEPRVLGSIFRIHRDTRFSTDKRPYKDHLDFWFWQGARKTAVSGLFLRVSPDT
jgi:hypothetical protein